MGGWDGNKQTGGLSLNDREFTEFLDAKLMAMTEGALAAELDNNPWVCYDALRDIQEVINDHKTARPQVSISRQEASANDLVEQRLRRTDPSQWNPDDRPASYQREFPGLAEGRLNPTEADSLGLPEGGRNGTG